MNYEIEISLQAERDLRDIYEYIAFVLLAPENAIGQLRRLEKGILSLKEYPMRHRKYEKEPWKNRGLRVLPVDNYVLFYIANERLKKVSIVRVMYSGRNIEEGL
ncbi:MAG: type II toxin-antitoxin system RelE/ParE family toxin [Lachnospiraceae bacterium]|jgi:plasmid stabilization system protein ParE|nr:type II toxin-antitoxin system RelE/ParE family toxin [Lachnospiraceae bacterium]